MDDLQQVIANISSPADKQKFRDAVNEAAGSLVRQDAEKDFRKEVADNMKEAFGISKADFNRVVKIAYENKLDEMRQQLDNLEYLYDMVSDDGNSQNEQPESDNGDEE